MTTMTRKQRKSPKAAIQMDVTDPWYAHNTSSHIPNAELRKALEEAEAGINMEPVTREELQKMWDDA